MFGWGAPQSSGCASWCSMCTGSGVSNILMFLCALGLFGNFTVMNFKTWGPPAGHDMSLGKDDVSSATLEGILSKQPKKILKTSEMGKIAGKLDELYTRVKDAKDMDVGDLLAIKNSHKRLTKMLRLQRSYFVGAWEELAIENPAQNKIAGTEHQKAAYAMQELTRHILKEELTDLEDLVRDLLYKVLTKLLGDDPKDQAYETAKKKLDSIHTRIFGMIAPLVPQLLDNALSHNAIVPTIREILAENASRVIKTKKGAVKAWLAGAVNNLWSNSFCRDQVQSFMNPILAAALPQARKSIVEKCKEWTAAKRKVDFVPKRQYWIGLDQFKRTPKRTAPAKKDKSGFSLFGNKDKKTKDSKAATAASKAPASQEIDLSGVTLDSNTDTIEKMKKLHRDILICHIVIAVLSVMLLFSWLYFCYGMHAISQNRKGSVDLELGEGSRRRSTKRRSRRSARHSSKNAVRIEVQAAHDSRSGGRGIKTHRSSRRSHRSSRRRDHGADRRDSLGSHRSRMKEFEDLVADKDTSRHSHKSHHSRRDNDNSRQSHHSRHSRRSRPAGAVRSNSTQSYRTSRSHRSRHDPEARSHRSRHSE